MTAKVTPENADDNRSAGTHDYNRRGFCSPGRATPLARFGLVRSGRGINFGLIRLRSNSFGLFRMVFIRSFLMDLGPLRRMR
ncbi:hypothetical protein OROMI_001881 [Orobanche minor]